VFVHSGPISNESVVTKRRSNITKKKETEMRAMGPSLLGELLKSKSYPRNPE
jgi:hypothetical protein